MTNIPEKYLNTNVRAMLGGGNVDEPEPQPEPEPEYVFYLNKIFSCFKKKYRLELKVIKEQS